MRREIARRMNLSPVAPLAIFGIFRLDSGLMGVDGRGGVPGTIGFSARRLDGIKKECG